MVDLKELTEEKWRTETGSWFQVTPHWFCFCFNSSIFSLSLSLSLFDTRCLVKKSRPGLFSFSLLPFHMLHRRAKSPWVWLDRSDVVKEHPSTQTVKNRTLILMRQCRWLQWTDVKYFDRLWVGAAVQRTNCCWQYHFNNVQRRELVIFTGYSAILLSAELL